MSFKEIYSAKLLQLEFYERNEFVMPGLISRSFEEFNKKFREGFCYGSQYTIKIRIDDKLILIEEYKKLLNL